ncbi:MAG: nitroreductase [Candidatus Latescibacterota bacterium]|nr:MAG: nitroreductase [Candidatus Latescibacterota bacterium]RKY73909.1 MAG: nitroreductase [Candidatus Latescibacterota bacterium]
MDVYQAIRERRSVRRYRPEPVPEEKLKRVLNAMRLAPSGKNAQPWRFIVVRDAAVREKLVDACNGQQFVGEAPVVIVGCGWERKAYPRMGGYWNSLPVDVAIALDHLTLAAAAEGLGTCWIGSFKEAAVKEILGIPDQVQVIALMPLGYPAVEPEAKPRKRLEEVVAFDGWS